MDTKKRYRNKTKGSGRLTLGLLAALLALAPGAWAGTLQVNGSTGSVSVPEGGSANVSWDFSENAPATGVLLRVNNGPMGPCTNPPPYPDFPNPDSGYSAGTVGGKALTLTNPSYVPGTTYYLKVCAWQLGGNPDNLGPESNTVQLNYGEGGGIDLPNLEALCKILDCGKPKIDPAKLKEMGAFLTKNKKDPLKGLQEALSNYVPIIEGAMSFPGWTHISPGATLLIKGRNFQPEQNEQVLVMLHGSFPGGLKQYLDDIEVLSDTAISAVVPQPIIGVQDHVVKIQVKKGPILGPKYDFGFLATRETKLLQAGDPAVKVDECGTAGDYDKCNGEESGSLTQFTTWGCGSNYAICAIHENDWNMIWSYDTGTDKYKISLKNGWIIQNADYGWKKTSSNETITPTPKSSAIGKTNWKPKVWWEVSPSDFIGYRYKIWIVGPKGVPHH